MNSTVQAERRKERRRTLIALAISLVFHLLIMLAAAIALTVSAWRKPATLPEPRPVELTLVPAPEKPPEEEKKFFDSTDGTVTEKPPENAAFESDRNTAAASTLPAQSNEPVPTLDGQDAMGLTLQARDLSLGPNKQPTAASPPAQPQAANAQPKPEPTPKQEAAEEKPSPTPKPRPEPKPEDAELALLDPAKPKTKPQPQEEVRKPEPPQRPTAPNPPGFQPQTRVTRLTGGISNRGAASVAAVATPLGRYKKAVSDAIGSRWYYYVSDQIDMVDIGRVELRFVIRADGRVQGLQVLRNTSNQSLANVSMRAIMEAEIPPIPRDVAQMLAGGSLEIDYSFTIVGN